MEPELRKTVELALAGDRAAFEALIGQYARLVYAQAFMILHDHADTEDVVQETFLRAYVFRVRLRNPDKFRNWLLSIARNLARDLLRRRYPRREVEAEAEALPETAGVADERQPGWELEALEREAQLEAAVAALPAHYRTALSLRYAANLDHRAIERSMGVSSGVLRGILGRALGGLRQRLRHAGFEGV